MPRKKEYNESEVTDRALEVFWKNGYSNTSARMLEKAMEINLFSIYASFKNKDGIYLASLKSYKRLNREKLLGPLMKGTSIEDIKRYFINFLRFTKEADNYKGCFLINTAQELGPDMTDAIKMEIDSFAKDILAAFTQILSKEHHSPRRVEKLTNFYFSSLVGIITTAGSLSQQQIDDFIELTFAAR